MAVEATATLQVVYRSSAEPLLTDAMRPFVAAALGEKARRSALHGIVECTVSVSGFISSDEDDDSEEFVLTQYVDLPPDAASDYWDALAAAMYEWAGTLPPTLQDTARWGIAGSVRRNQAQHAAAI
jgi:hypothetical protein